MKDITEYKKSAAIYLVPNLRNGNSLKIEFSILAPVKVISRTLERFRGLGFSCTESVSHSNFTQHPNVIDIALDLCTDEREVAHDVFTYLETVLGKDQVIDRVRTTIKKENNKMKQ